MYYLLQDTQDEINVGKIVPYALSGHFQSVDGTKCLPNGDWAVLINFTYSGEIEQNDNDVFFKRSTLQERGRFAK